MSASCYGSYKTKAPTPVAVPAPVPAYAPACPPGYAPAGVAAPVALAVGVPSAAAAHAAAAQQHKKCSRPWGWLLAIVLGLVALSVALGMYARKKYAEEAARKADAARDIAAAVVAGVAGVTAAHAAAAQQAPAAAAAAANAAQQVPATPAALAAAAAARYQQQHQQAMQHAAGYLPAAPHPAGTAVLPNGAVPPSGAAAGVTRVQQGVVNETNYLTASSLASQGVPCTVLYTADWCTYCPRAKAELAKAAPHVNGYVLSIPEASIPPERYPPRYPCLYFYHPSSFPGGNHAVEMYKGNMDSGSIVEWSNHMISTCHAPMTPS